MSEPAITRNPFTLAQRYVGMPYVAGEFDCADLAVRVQREVFGREVALPAHHPGGARTQGALILRLRDELAVELAEPVDGCAVLLWEPDDYAPDELRLWHIGTVFLHAGEVWVLHASARICSVALHRLADLRRWGLRVEGFYAWRAGA